MVKEEKEQNLNKIGGWLLFFIITLILNSLSLFLISYAEGDSILFLFTLIYFLCPIFLILKKKFSVKYAIIIFVILLIVNLINIEKDTPEKLANSITDLIYPIILLLYLFNSDRVRIVYKIKKKFIF